jgi:uncharacterized protein YbcI
LEPVPFPVTNSLKKDIAQLYNEINQEIFGLGVRKQRIEIIDNKIIIFGQHKRVPALAILEKRYHELILSVDAALVSEYKQRLREQIERMLHIKVVTILKDYDSGTEQACTVVYLEKSLQQL